MEPRPWQRHYDFDVPTTIRYPRVPAHHFLNIPASSFPDKPATNFYGTELTYWELRAQALTMANALGNLGVRQGDRVGVHLPNCPQYVIAYFAVLSLGAVVVNLNPMYTADELKHCIASTGIKTLFTFDMVLANIRAACQEDRSMGVIVTRVTDYIDGFPRSTAAEMELAEGWRHFSELLDATPQRKLPRVDIHPGDPALIQFTGGTTGIPKGAVLTHHNIVAATLRSIATEIDAAASAVTEPAEMIGAAVTFVWERPAFPRMLAALILEGYNVTELMGDHPFLRRLGAAAASTTLDADPQTAAGLAVTIILGAGSYGRAVNVAIGRDPSDQRLPEAIRRVAASRA